MRKLIECMLLAGMWYFLGFWSVLILLGIGFVSGLIANKGKLNSFQDEMLGKYIDEEMFPFVDVICFRDMLCRSYIANDEDPNEPPHTVLDLRRNGDGSWDSQERGKDWQPMNNYSKIEIAFQRYLHGKTDVSQQNTWVYKKIMQARLD